VESIDWEQLRREVRLKLGWDVDAESFSTGDHDEPSKMRREKRWLLIFLAVVFALLAVLSFVRVFAGS